MNITLYRSFKYIPGVICELNDSHAFCSNYGSSRRENNTIIMNETETLLKLNARYAATILPFTIVLGCCGVAGIVGNLLVFIVYGFGKQFREKKYRHYVLTLAAIDLVTCLTLIPAEMVKHRSYFNFTEQILCKTKCFFNVFAASAASYCLTLVAVDRYIMTCHPLFFSRLQKYSLSIASRLCVVFIFIAIVTSFPAAILCGITKTKMADINNFDLDVYLCETEPRYEKLLIRYIYRSFLGSLLIIICVIIIVLYAQIGRAVMKFVRVRHTQNDGTISMEDLTGGEKTSLSCHTRTHAHMPCNMKLLFVVTMVFIVTYIFYFTCSWIDQTKLSPVQFLLFSILFRLYFIHSVINPLLYIKMDRYFRKRCVHIMTTFYRTSHGLDNV